MSNTPGIDAIHLVPGSSFRLMKTPRVHAGRDCLSYGRCDLDPAKHIAARIALWAPDFDITEKDFDLLPVLESAPTQPIVVWTSREWPELLWLWWAVDTLARLGIGPQRLWVAGADLAWGIGVNKLEALTNAVPMTAAFVAEARAMWCRFADPSPLAFDLARRTKNAHFPSLATDEMLLSGLNSRFNKWTRIVKEHDEALFEQFMRPYGDGLIVKRLHQWVAFSAVERRRADGPVDEFRITASGLRLLDTGLDDIAGAPPSYIGGCEVHSPTAPFFRIALADGWRLIQSGPSI